MTLPGNNPRWRGSGAFTMGKVSNISQRRRSAQTVGSADYAAKREELVRIAARLFKEQGYQSTKLADIAREAGLDRATVYYYVGSKEELFRETVEGVLDVNMAAAERLIADRSLSWRDRLHSIYVTLMVSYEENYPATFVYIQEQMHQVGGEETIWAQEIMKKTRAFDQTLIRFIREAIGSGELRADIPPRLVENALFGMLNWTHRWFTPGGPMTGLEVAEAFWSIFIDGMGSKETA
ncbi:TetR/AcrR family transcriptional regulator [Sphingomonas sp. ID0503]|uniref:TetR/AcrR family transcriptional regulator n=1 Tax=Sphingomonas sp. ID0503 TaxID=3399691 RepID=UPI003AFAA0F6